MIKILIVIAFGLIFLLVATTEAYDAGYGRGRRDERIEKMHKKEDDEDVVS